MTAIAERAAAGAAFLDEHDPGWWEHDGYRCILGQRCPLELPDGGPSRYYLHAGALSGIHVPPDRPLLAEHEIHAWAFDRGFDAGAGENFDGLTAEWRKIITA